MFRQCARRLCLHSYNQGHVLDMSTTVRNTQFSDAVSNWKPLAGCCVFAASFMLGGIEIPIPTCEKALGFYVPYVPNSA